MTEIPERPSDTVGPRVVLVAVLAVFVLLFSAIAAWAGGELGQDIGARGCTSENGTDGVGGPCELGKAVRGATSIVISPDGKNAYLASRLSRAVATFDRDPESGTLTEKPGKGGCISEDGTDKAGRLCREENTLIVPRDVAISPDGKSVYIASDLTHSLTVFDRNSDTGALAQRSGEERCISQGGSGSCAAAKALRNPSGIVISPDGKNVYVASAASDAIATLRRDPASGELSQSMAEIGCIAEDNNDNTGNSCEDGKGLEGARDVAISSDGKNVYVASANNDSLAVFRRVPTSGRLEQLTGDAGCISQDSVVGGCQLGRGLDGANGVVVSLDGKSVYVASFLSSAIAVFERDAETGALTQLAGESGCASQSGGGGCAKGDGLAGAAAVTVSPDGKSVYVASAGSNALSIFSRDAAVGSLTQLGGQAGCFSQNLATCQQGRALSTARGVATSPNSESIYVAAEGSNAVATFDRVVLGPPNSGGSAGQGGNGASQGDRRGHGERDRDGRVLKITGFRVSPRRVQPAPRGRLSFRFTLSEPARVKVTIESVRPGRKVGKRCKAQAPKLVKRPRCKRFIPAGRLSFQGRNAGANKIRFKARVRKRTLKPGAYRATIVATDRAGNSSAPKRAAFRVLAKKRR